MPWRMAAGENGFVRVDAEGAAAGLDRNLERARWGLGAGHVLGILGLFCSRTHDFALKPKPPRRVARALSPRARADRRLRRCRHARGARAAGQGPAAGADLVARPDAGAARAAGITPLPGNLDQPATLARLAGLATRVVHLAPPPGEGNVQWWRDLRTARVAAGPAAAQPAGRRWCTARPAACTATAAAKGSRKAGRCARARRAPSAAPTRRRRSATSAARRTCAASILRIPGIYAPDREGGTPRERLLKGTPVLRSQ